MADHPHAFGQHPNADIQSAIQDTQDLLSTVISLQPRVVTAGGQSNESKVLTIAAELERTLPESFNVEEVVSIMSSRSDPDPLKTVLFQEVDRYNKLLGRMRRSLVDLQKGVKGECDGLLRPCPCGLCLSPVLMCCVSHRSMDDLMLSCRCCCRSGGDHGGVGACVQRAADWPSPRGLELLLPLHEAAWQLDA